MSSLGSLLIHFRDYLMLIAGEEMDPALRAKLGPSDIVQQTLLNAVGSFGTFRGRSGLDLARWLRKILLNELLDARRRYLGTNKRNMALELPLEGQPRDAGIQLQVATDTPLPFARLAANEDFERLAAAVERLPRDDRELLRLRYWERRSLIEISQTYGRTENAVRKHWARAIERLQREYHRDA